MTRRASFTHEKPFIIIYTKKRIVKISVRRDLGKKTKKQIPTVYKLLFSIRGVRKKKNNRKTAREVYLVLNSYEATFFFLLFSNNIV